MDTNVIVKNRPADSTMVRGTIEVTVSMALAGLSVVLGRMLKGQVPVFLTGMLSAAAALGFMLAAQVFKVKELKRLTLKDLKYMALQALFGIVLFRIFSLYGLKFTTAADAGIILSMTPGMLTLSSVLLLKERPSILQMGGAGLALAASVIITLAGGGGHANDAFLAPGGGSRVLGNALMFCAVLSECMLTIFRKKSGGAVGSITNTTVLCVISLCAFLPFALLETRSFDLSAISRGSWTAILLYGLAGTALAYILWGDGSARIPGFVTGTAMAALPVSSLVLSFLILREPISAAHLLGAAAGAAGIIMGTLGPYHRPSSSSRERKSRRRRSRG